MVYFFKKYYQRQNTFLIFNYLKLFLSFINDISKKITLEDFLFSQTNVKFKEKQTTKDLF